MISVFLRYKKILITLIIITITWLGFHSKKKITQPSPTMIESMQVEENSIPVSVNTIGTLIAANHIKVAAEVPGQIVKILFQDGAKVKKGTPLFQLDDAALQVKLEAAQAKLELSLNMYKRIAALAKKGIISKQELEKSLADLKEKKSIAEEANVLLKKMTLVAPFDGVVGKSLVSVGDYVTAGQALVSLTDLIHLRVDYTIPEKYLSKLKQGLSVTITTSAYPDKIFSGQLVYIAPTINTESHTITTYAEIDNTNLQLLSGLFVNVEQFLENKEHALLIPTTAILTSIDGSEVYKVINGKAILTKVTFGQHFNENVQVISGLTKKDFVVTSGLQKIRDGMPVTTIH